MVQDYQLALSFRLMQGVAGGATWAASIAWLLRLYPIEQRGEALRLAVTPAFVGTIAGPLIGTMALDLGIRGPYTAVAMLCFVAAAWLLRMPRPPLRGSLEKARPATLGQRRRLALLGGVTDGHRRAHRLINLAGPLVLVRLGAAERTSGVVFVIAAVATMIIARPLGITVDRWGATGPQQRGCS